MEPPTYSGKAADGKDVSGGAREYDVELDHKHASHDSMPGELISAGSEHLHRKLGGKEIQLLAVGGAIGTCTQFLKSPFKGYLSSRRRLDIA